MNKQTRNHAFTTFFKILFSFFLIGAITLPAQAQPVKRKSCKVKIKELEGEFDGYCLKGLAHGEGMAKGEHTYKGEFKKGLPHGTGVYTYTEGSRYEGEFKNGMRHGKGKMFKMGQEPVYGQWKNDEMIRELFEEDYKVIIQRNVTAIRARVQDTRKNRIEFFFNRGANIEQMDIVSQSGQLFQDNNLFRLEDVIFPEKIRMNYKVWDKLMSTQSDVLIDIEFTSPGNWRLDITH
jgi:hypothetical protein